MYVHLGYMYKKIRNVKALKSCHWCDYIDTTIVSLHHGLYCHALYICHVCEHVCVALRLAVIILLIFCCEILHIWPSFVWLSVCYFVFFFSVVLFFSYSLVVPCATPYSTFRRLRTMQSSIALSFFFIYFGFFFSFKVQSFTGGRNFF